MREKQIFVARGGTREKVDSLNPFLDSSLKTGLLMDRKLMRRAEAEKCRWIGFGITKGVTDPCAEISIVATLEQFRAGLHGEFVQVFPNVDPIPLCYDSRNQINGFGWFVRWVYFASPCGGPGFIGIDFSLTERLTSGVATSLITVMRVAKVFKAHGIDGKTRLVLLNCRMCEDPELENLREQAELFTLDDWCEVAPLIFGPNGYRCPRCGLPTFLKDEKFCSRCGCKPELIYKKKFQLRNVIASD